MYLLQLNQGRRIMMDVFQLSKWEIEIKGKVHFLKDAMWYTEKESQHLNHAESAVAEEVDETKCKAYISYKAIMFYLGYPKTVPNTFSTKIMFFWPNMEQFDQMNFIFQNFKKSSSLYLLR